MTDELNWDQFEVVNDNQPQLDWETYQPATPSPGQAFVEAIQGALPAAGHMLSSAGRGLYDLGGGNIPNAPTWQESLKEHLLGMIGRQSERQQQYAYSPKRAVQSMAAGLLEGGRDLANVPGNIVDYLKDQGAPSWLQAWRPSQAVQDFDYRDFVGLEGNRPGDELIEGITRTLPATGLTMGAPGVGAGVGAYGGIGLSAVGQNENPLTAMLGAGILHAGTKLPGAIKKGGNAIGEKVIDPLKDQFIEKPKQLEQIKQENLVRERQKVDATRNLLEADQDIVSAFEDYQKISKADAKLDLAESVKEYYDNTVQETANKKYADLESAYGSKRVFEPVQPEFFKEQYSFPEGTLSETTQQMIDNTFGTYEAIESRDPLTGQPRFNVEKTKGNPTVSNYIDLWRQLRDEAYHLRKQAKGENVSFGDAQNMRTSASSLEKLAKDVSTKARNSMPEKGQRMFDDAQTYYKENVIPFKKGFLSKMIQETPEVNYNEVLRQFDKKGFKPLKEAMLKDEGFKEAVNRHDLSHREISTGKQLRKLMNDDLSKTLSPEKYSEAQNILDRWENADQMITEVTQELKEQKLTAKEIEARTSRIAKLVSAGSKKAAYLLGLKWVLGGE